MRQILLKAAKDPIPAPDRPDVKGDTCSAWGWPAPRIDAAQGLVLLIAHLPKGDRAPLTAIKALSRDKSGPVRFNLARILPVLEKTAPRLMWQVFDIVVAEDTHYSVLDAVVHSLALLRRRHDTHVISRLNKLCLRAKKAPAEHAIHESIAHAHLFRFLDTGREDSEKYIATLIRNCGEQRENKALLAQLHACRVGGWMTAGDAVQKNSELDSKRSRTWKFLFDSLHEAQMLLKDSRQRWTKLRDANKTDTPEMKQVESEIPRLAQFIDGIGMQLYFASGAFAEKQNKDEDKLTPVQLRRFWHESFPLLKALAEEPHPHIAYQSVQTLHHLLPCDPEQVFLLAATAIQTSSAGGFQHESLAAGEVVKLVQTVLADYREIFRSKDGHESPCLVALLAVLDLFVEAGWPEARQLTHRLEEIYR